MKFVPDRGAKYLVESVEGSLTMRVEDGGGACHIYNLHEPSAEVSLQHDIRRVNFRSRHTCHEYGIIMYS